MSLSCRSSKKNSKRQPVKLRFSIQKKAMANKKKMKKLARVTGAVKKSRRKDPGIPNNFPLKHLLLDEIARKKDADRDEKMARRRQLRDARSSAAATAEERGSSALPLAAARKTAAVSGGEDYDFGEIDLAVAADGTANGPSKKSKKIAETFGKERKYGTGSIDEMAAAAKQSAALFDESIDEDAKKLKSGTKPSNGVAFMRELNKIIQQSDVVLKVLDARDPNGCRSPKIERYILSSGKKLVFVMNKIDLVPTEVARQWLTYLRRVAPTVAFKCLISAGVGSARAKLSKGGALKATKGQLESNTQVLGAGTLMELLKNYSRIEGIEEKRSKGPLTAGIIGHPNVGKSSIINSLKRSSGAVRTGGEAGITRTLQVVQLDKRIKLIDSPGVIFNAEGGNDDIAASVLRNAVKIADVREPIGIVELIVNRTPPDTLMRLFKVPAFSTANEFVAHVARARGKLLKGGAPDNDAAARAVLTEWTSGRLRHYCMPPTVQEQEAAIGVKDSAVVVGSFAKEFDIDALWSQNDEEMVHAEPENVAGVVGSIVVGMQSASLDEGSSSSRHADAVSAVLGGGAQRRRDGSLPQGLMQVTEGVGKTRKDDWSADNIETKRKRRRALLVEEAEKKEEAEEKASSQQRLLRVDKRQRLLGVDNRKRKGTAAAAAAGGGRRRQSSVAGLPDMNVTDDL